MAIIDDNKPTTKRKENKKTENRQQNLNAVKKILTGIDKSLEDISKRWDSIADTNTFDLVKQGIEQLEEELSTLSDEQLSSLNKSLSDTGSFFDKLSDKHLSLYDVNDLTSIEKAISEIDAQTDRLVAKQIKLHAEIKDESKDTSEYHENKLHDLRQEVKSLEEQKNKYKEIEKQLKAAILSEEKRVSINDKEARANAAIKFKLAEIQKDQELYEIQNRRYDLLQAAQRATENSLRTQLELQKNILKDAESSDEARLEAVDKAIELEKQLQEIKETTAAQEIKANRLLEAKRLASEDKSSLKTELGSFFTGVKDIFNMNKEAGMSNTSALFNIEKVIKAGNDNLSKNFASITNVVMSGFSALNSIIDHAAKVYETSNAKVNAAIDGSGKTFKDYTSGLTNFGISTLAKQEDLLTNLSNIATSGISRELEQLALLTTIRDKTVASFDVTDSNLRRLVRLNSTRKDLTAAQFGLAAVLRSELNNAFGDSSYISKMFQQLTGTIMDAVSANTLNNNNYDSTNFYSVMETFAAGLYEAGVDEGTVSAIAQGINYLGSGNVQALSGNKALQNLMLLSMDRAGLDYATILQQGLNTSDTYKLLSEIIDYLADITDNTKENNVLRSSYANLFNLSTTDMLAIKNLSKNKTFGDYAISSVAQDNGTMLLSTMNELIAADERTFLSEKIDNFIENVKFSLGVGTAGSSWAYPTYLISKLGGQAAQSLGAIPGIGNVASKVLGVASVAGYAASLIPGVKNLISNLKDTNFNTIGASSNTLTNYFYTNLSKNSKKAVKDVYDEYTSMVANIDLGLSTASKNTAIQTKPETPKLDKYGNQTSTYDPRHKYDTLNNTHITYTQKPDAAQFTNNKGEFDSKSFSDAMKSYNEQQAAESAAAAQAAAMPSMSFQKNKKLLKTFGGTPDEKKYEETTNAWLQDEENLEDPNVKILKEFEKTLMKAENSDGYAFAVSLQGMSDGVLRSFASIFADENAMMETLTGKNNALKDNNTFIDFVSDTSSKEKSSKNDTSKSKNK